MTHTPTHKLVIFSLVALVTACQLSTVREDLPSTGSPPLLTPVPSTGSGTPITAPPPALAPTAPAGSDSPPPESVAQYGVWLHPGLPPAVVAAVAPLLDNAAFYVVGTPQEAAIQVTLWPGDASPLRADWIYAVVAPFPTVPDEIAWEALGRYWQGDPNALPDFGGARLVLSPDTVEILTIAYGPPAPTTPLIVAPAEQVLDHAWANAPALSVVPFESLEPRWKVLALDGQSPLDKALNTRAYRFNVEIGLAGDPQIAAQAAEVIRAAGGWRASNFDPARMSVVTMTGVTALSRAVAWNMEQIGIVEQGADIKPALADADILHISNEVAFATDCPPPDPHGDPKFCSDDRYVALLQDLGPDLIELTGNHINDWGTGAFVHTLDVYDQNGMAYFGGGRTLEEAERTVVLTSSGNRIAFLGCNLPGPNTAFATDSSAGVAPCNDYLEFNRRVAAAREQADVVIATQQYWEFDHADATPQQVAHFGAIVDAGADIVIGSQAHWPQGFAFHNSRFVHYGTGNLFFDPFEDEKKQIFIDKLIIYEGRHISTLLLTGRIADYGRPVPMSLEERRDFLTSMFAVSGW